MKKRLPFFTALLVVFVLLYFVFTFGLLPSIKVATGYAAKYVCSATFISGLNETIIKNDLDLFPVSEVEYTINKKENYVEASLFGFGKQKAWFYQTDENCGCKLNIDESKHELSNSSVVPVPELLDTIDWPFGDRILDTIIPELDIQKIRQIVQETMDSNHAARALLVNYKNYLIAENYAPGVDVNTRLLGWSMTKTISNALIGNLVKNKRMDISQPANIDGWQQDERKKITINNLLQMSSGLEWEEDYSKISHVTKMLFQQRDLSAFAMSSPAVFKPGEVWRYSSGTTNILSFLIKSAFEDEVDYLSFPKDSLFDMIGMRSAMIEMDDANTFVLSSYCWATARDWTRFGLLYLNQGMANGHEVFTPEWTAYTLTPAPASGDKYGAQIWLNKAQTELPSAPPDAFYEDGFGGQTVLVIPSKELVVVLLSGQQKNFDFDRFILKILNCFQ